MTVEQIYTGCLAQGAYYIKSEDEAVIIDPLREVQPYIDRAKADGVKIKYVLETHFHADFVSGHIDLANATGATIVFGPNAKTNYDVKVASDGDILKVGKLEIKVLHTPGHTMESTTYLLRDENGKDYAIFSGDTLFIGDVGRPDLAVKSDLTQEDLASHLFDSLRNKIMPLSDDVLVYPAHGAGSACGKNMSKETFDTLGNQKINNYALRADMTREEFIKEVTDGLATPPAYFPQNVMMNKMGYDSVNIVLERGLKALNAMEFEAAANETGALILDTRHHLEFTKGFIPNAINIGIDGGFAPWVGALIPDVKTQLLLVTEPGREEETVTRLARVGYDFPLGYLKGGIESWISAGKEVDTVNTITPERFAKIFNEKTKVFDVRKDGEFLSEHLKEAENTPLDNLNDYMAQFPQNETFYIHCAGGYRSMIAASILNARGIRNFVNVDQGFKAIKEAGVPATEYVCPSTLK